MIPYRMNPLGISGAVNWRNFHDNPIVWTEYNLLNLQQYNELTFEVVFTPSVNYRDNPNQPLFGAWGGTGFPLFLSIEPNRNTLLVYIYGSGGAFVLWGWPQFIYTPGQKNNFICSIPVGSPVTGKINDASSRVTSNNFPGFPANGTSSSRYDGTIQKLRVTSGGNLVWEAPKNLLTE